MPAMPTAYSYIRFSSDQQKHGASLERQKAAVAAWHVANPDYILSAASFQDLGFSGWKGEHLENAFGRLLAAVQNGVIQSGDVILVEAIDRAGRLPPDKMLNILTSITSAGVSLISLDDGITYDSNPARSNNLFLLVAKVQQAWQYSDALSRRVRDAYQRKRDKAARGEVVKRRTPVWLDGEGELVPEVVPFVVQAFEDYATGLGERRIHRRIVDHTDCPESLQKLSPGTVKKWFRNKTAIGYWGESPKVYPAVVSDELFYQVQKRLSEVYKAKPAASSHFLGGLVKCARCGSNLARQHTKRSPATMICVKYIRLGRKGCDNNKSIPYSVLDYIRSQTTFAALQRAQQLNRLTSTEKRLVVVEGELADLIRQRDNALGLAIKYGETPALAAELESLVSRIRPLEVEKATLASAPAESTVDDAIELQEVLLDDDQARLNALLQDAGYRMVCDGASIQVEEPSLHHGEGPHVIQYLGVDRKRWLYRLTWDGEEVLLPGANPDHEQQARELEEHLSQPSTKVLRWNGSELVEDAAPSDTTE